jgi:hypothetical protein
LACSTVNPIFSIVVEPPALRRITLAMLYLLLLLLLLLPNPLPQRANPYQYNAIDLSPAPHYGRIT